MKKIAAIVLIVALLCGCSAVPAGSRPAPEALAPPADPTAVPVSASDTEERQSVSSPAVDTDILALQIKTELIDTFAAQTAALTVPVTGSVGELLATYTDELTALPALLDAAMEDAFSYACAMSKPTATISDDVHIDITDWKLVTAVARAQGDFTPLARSAQVTASPTDGGFTATVLLATPGDLLASLATDTGFSATLMYAYLNTVYDDSGAEKDFVQYTLPDGYLQTLADPLPGRYIKDGWYNDRSNGTRKHTGTDIVAPADEAILSCTDGTVLNIGSSEGAGNYVVIADSYGFQYHYYHMIRMTDFLQVGDTVTRGQTIGSVGNTGNSDTNHLHLTIVSPEYTYVNPYPILRDLRELTA